MLRSCTTELKRNLKEILSNMKTEVKKEVNCRCGFEKEKGLYVE